MAEELIKKLWADRLHKDLDNFSQPFYNENMGISIHEIDDLVFGATSDQTNSNIIVISTPKSKDPEFTKIIQPQLTEVQKWLRN